MLYYDRTEVFKGIGIDEISESNECNIWHYWHFLDKEFKFQSDICNGCHDLLIIFVNLSNITILNIHDANYCCIISGISKNEAIKLIQNINFTAKKVLFF